MKATETSKIITSLDECINVSKDAKSILEHIVKLKELIKNKHCVCPDVVKPIREDLERIEQEVILNMTLHKGGF